jgi:hypothetical protein
MTWSTRNITIDPGVTALILRGQQLNGSGWRVVVYRRARRALRVGGWLIEAALWGLVFCVLVVLLALLA